MNESQRQKQKENTKRQILDIAIKLFGINGFTTTRTSDIAAAAKVSHGTIFAHFATRDILLEAAIEEIGDHIVKRLHELVDVNAGLQQVLEAHLKGIGEYEAFYTHLVLEGKLLHENSRNTLVAIQSAISFHINEIAEREMNTLRIKTIPMDLLFNTWIGLVHHYLVNSDLFAPKGSVIESHGKRLIEHYINMITK